MESESISNINFKDFENYLDDFTNNINQKNIVKNKKIKEVLKHSKKQLVDMLDASYQEAFTLAQEKRKSTEK